MICVLGIILTSNSEQAVFLKNCLREFSGHGFFILRTIAQVPFSYYRLIDVRTGKMLVVAGFLVILAMLFFFIDKWFDSASIDLKWYIRLLIFFAALLIIYHTYRAGNKPEYEGPLPRNDAAVPE